MEQESFGKRFLKAVLIVAEFTVFIFATFILTFDYFEATSEKEVPTPIPKMFRLFVSNGEKFEIIEFGELENYKEKNPNYSFFVRKNNLESINETLAQRGFAERSKFIPKIHIEKEFEGKQIVKISHGGDGIFTFRYEAEEKKIKPLTMNVQGPGFIFSPCFVTAFIGFVAFCLLQFILWLKKRKQKRTENIGD